LGVEVVGDTVHLRDSAEELAIREGIGRQM
jgi:hypothetical protein